MRRGLGLALGGRTMTPARLSNVVGWYRASVGVTLVSGGVSQWDDLSSHGRHLTQATASARPTVNATGIGGKPALVFDNTNDLLASVDMLPWNGDAPRTMFVVYAKTNASQFGYVAGAGKVIGAGGAFAIFSGNTGFANDPRLVTDVATISSPHTPTTTPMIVEASYDGQTARVRKNAFAYTSAVQALSTVGSAPFQVGFFDGMSVASCRVAEIILMASQARTDEVARALAYLGGEYGVVL